MPTYIVLWEDQSVFLTTELSAALKEGWADGVCSVLKIEPPEPPLQLSLEGDVVTWHTIENWTE